jgi:hypothetical protein
LIRKAAGSLTALLVALLVVFFGHGSDAVASPAVPQSSYTYDDPHRGVETVRDIDQRGPPEITVQGITFNAVGPWSTDASALPERATRRSDTSNRDLGWVVRGGRGIATTLSAGLRLGVVASSRPCWRVAAETADAGASTLGRDAAESCLNSFTGDTPVLMADGSEKPIKDVKVGDNVLATDPETGETKAEPVEQLIRHSGRHAMVLVALADGSVLDSTDGHPIWDATSGQFTHASQLHVGDQIETRNHQLITVTGLTTYSADLTAYNLQIDEIHTYYAGVTPVLVHNSCGPPFLAQTRGARMTTPQATELADYLGFTRVKGVSHGQAIYTDGKVFISPDVDGHSLGAWKMASSVDGFGPSQRLGTYDFLLNWIAK